MKQPREQKRKPEASRSKVNNLNNQAKRRQKDTSRVMEAAKRKKIMED